MPSIEELPSGSGSTAKSPKAENMELESDSEDEFHDACDRVAPREGAAIEFTEEEILDLLSRAELSKSQGNKLYVEDRWEEAKEHYKHGLTCAPKRKHSPPKPTPNGREGRLDPRSSTEPESRPPEAESSSSEELSELEKKSASLRAQLNCNVGACCVKLVRHPYFYSGRKTYHLYRATMKEQSKPVLKRRASSNELIGSWSALTSAESDYTTLLELLPPSSKGSVRVALTRLKPRVQEAKEKETAEMMGKLKDLGNSLLGRFGLSTDNFQFTPNGQGGYGINFVR
ncbi:TPR_2 domain-containing protein [Rhizoctonia solani AG-1 IA]|uniref:TPR_2 domain-containing protein n=1 Tax=Thanatephorus cucumeris (strain AG1-IA) TaxID=983506 RepID=L8WM78_THACA|nr:TPR_2 domain-containing protein [Rhizoctonia solani AG-1 IA]